MLDQISFWQYLGFKKIKQKCNFGCAATSMTMSQFLNFVAFTKTQKTRRLEKETLFSVQIKKIVNYDCSLIYSLITH